jgi:hypothetical protein
VSELLKLGFGRIISPEGTSEDPQDPGRDSGLQYGRAKTEVVEVKTLEEAVGVVLN